MEDLIESIAGILIVIVAFLVKSAQKKQRKETVSAQQAADTLRAEMSAHSETERKLKPAPPAAAARAAAMQSMATADVPDHRHEGKSEAPCPATEKRPSERRDENAAAAPAIPGLKLTFDRNTVLQGFVMSEILNRPRPGMRR